MSVDYLNYYIIENTQNTEESPGDLRRLVVTQTPGTDHQLKLTCEISHGVNNNSKDLFYC